MELRKRVGIVTGASRGIGVHIAEALARKGVSLALAARSEGDLKETASRLEQFGIETTTVPTDVTKLDELEHLVAQAERDLGPVDLLVNNAGIEHYSPFEDYRFEQIEMIIRTNLVAAEWLARLVLPGMIERRSGHVCNVASLAGKIAVPYNAIYSSTKHGLVGFSLSLREEMRRHEVEVSVVCPGYVEGAGMFHDWSRGKKPPGMTSAVPVADVAARTVQAIEKNKAQTVVAPALLKISPILQGVSPEVVSAIGRRSGGYRYIEKVAVEAWRDR